MTTERQPAPIAAAEFMRRLARDEALTDDDLRQEITKSVVARAQKYLDTGYGLAEATARAESEWFDEALLVYARGMIALVEARAQSMGGEMPLDPPTPGDGNLDA